MLAYAMVEPRYGPTGGAAEFMRGERFVPAALAICHDSEADGYLLFGCDAEWNAVTDTWHQTVKDAQHQARETYPGIGERWMRG